MSQKSLTDIVSRAVARGLSNADIIAENPENRPHSIMTMACMARKKLGMLPVRSMDLPPGIREGFEQEAKRRRSYSASVLIYQVLAIIVRDNMFDAILDEGK